MNRHPHPRVLITGASIAGPALAWGLERAGYGVTLLAQKTFLTSAKNVPVLPDYRHLRA